MVTYILESTFFEDVTVPPETTEWVLEKFTERRLRKHQVLFSQGDPGNEMYVVKSGQLKIFREGEDKEIVFGHQFPGQTIGELEVVHRSSERLASVAAIEDTVLWMIRKPDVDKLIDRFPQILRNLFYVVSERLAQADRKLEYLAFLDARVRVANILLDLLSNFGVPSSEGQLIDWKITQQHLGNMIGISRESAARILIEFQQEGIILVEKRLITILNLDHLHMLAEITKDPVEKRHWHSTYKHNIQ
ncbi:Crp/Fnr family transcriptional regulator [Gorillibacterium timonense]|uniref:Crp/Fnr family transcriptional regulator n=1 Tax=Gorillibacterium timonense TaxID=1689269 RepID=UPI00071CF475|nr:Crp/Fnr family transcriptional regulator [Gorillibacterium timonense]